MANNIVNLAADDAIEAEESIAIDELVEHDSVDCCVQGLSKLKHAAVRHDATTLRSRAGHVSAQLGPLVLIFGGYSDMNEYHSPFELLVYHTELRKWFVFLCSGEAPPESSGASAVVVGLTLYLFGGYYINRDWHHEGIDDVACCIFALDLRSMAWTCLKPSTQLIPTPRHKFVSWHCNGSKLYFFGGFGYLPGFMQIRANGVKFLQANDGMDFQQDHVSLGWNNQLISFDLNTKQWLLESCCGTIPPPRAAHCIAQINENEVVLFGGRYLDLRLNDLYVLDMRSLSWRQISRLPSVVWPEGRSWSSLSRIGVNRLLLYGGFTTNQAVLNDRWILDTETWTWQECLTVNRDGLNDADAQEEASASTSRLWHTMVSSGEDGCAYAYGGCGTNILNPNVESIHLRSLEVIQTQPSSLQHLSLRCAAAHIRSERLHELDELLPPNLRNLLTAQIHTETFVTDKVITSVPKLLAAL